MKPKPASHEGANAHPKGGTSPQDDAYVTISQELWNKLANGEGAAGESAEALKDRLLRTQADWDNYRKRAIKEKEDAVKYAAEGVLDKLLPVIDNFEMGLAAAQNSKDSGTVVEGLGMVLSRFQNLLREQGVETIDAMGKMFDPHMHEALGHIETSEHPEGTVVQQTRKGYKLKDRLLRPATVFVAKAPGS